jgi:hypothetical protein
MAEVKWMKGIEYVSGLLSKRPKKGSAHSSHSSALLATHRTAPTLNPVCTRLYAIGEYNRSTLPDQDELNRRTKFAAVSRAVAARRQNLGTIAADQAAFVAQKDQPDGKKTFTAYLWKVCGDAYDQNNG